MSIATRISSYRVPCDIWRLGHIARPDLPPLQLAARDALEIERRAGKRVNLQNEARRYVLCCERMQDIASGLAASGLLAPPMVWPRRADPERSLPSARAYLALMEALRTLRSRVTTTGYGRYACLFFPPDDAKEHLSVIEELAQHRQIRDIAAAAARSSLTLGPEVAVSAEECGWVLARRTDVLRAVAEDGAGLVDVVELVY